MSLGYSIGVGDYESPNESNKVGVGGVSTPNLAVALHVRLKCEISVVFGLLKAAVDEVPKETTELTTGTLKEADLVPPIYGVFVLPQLDRSVFVDRTGIAYATDDPDEHDCMDSMVNVDAKPKAKPKPKAAKSKPKKGAAGSTLGVDAGLRTNLKQHLQKGLDHRLMRPPAAQNDEEHTQHGSQLLVGYTTQRK